MITESGFTKNFVIGKETLSDEARQQITEFINSSKDHPALLYHYLIDEPENIRASATLLKEMYDFIRELDPYHPPMILNGDEFHGITASDSAVHLTAWTYNGTLTIIAYNVETKEVPVTITIPSDILTLHVVSEKRQLGVKAGSFTNRFIPLFGPYR